MSGKISAETIYGTQEESHVMSEKVQSLAATVYNEFEKMIKKYDENVVKDLMPLVVGILESLDAASTEKSELDVEIELLREDNEQLLTQYEREKQLRKTGDQKYLELEDTVEGVKKELEDKVETLESILRMSEIKAKNSADHVSRLEEKETEARSEYTKLHERYTELFRTHMDYMERTKILMGTDKLSDLTGNSPRLNKGGFSLPGLRPVSVAYGGAMEFQNRFDGTPVGFDTSTPQSSHSVSLKNELGGVDTPKSDLVLSEKEQFGESVDVTEASAGTTSSLTPSSIPASGLEKPPKSPSDLENSSVIAQPAVGTSHAPITPHDSVIDSSSSQTIVVGKPVKETEHSEVAVAEEEKPVVLRRKKKKSEDENKFEHSLSYEEDALPVKGILTSSPGLDQTLANIVATTPELDELQESIASQDSVGKRKSVRNDNSIFEELSVQGPDMIAEVDFGADITDSDDNAREEENEEEEDDKENDKDSVGDNFFGMGKELENLIMENTELLATKNALNIVKDDLIAKVDELSSEQEILREEITSLQAMRGRLQLRITQLEEELKKVREDNEKKEKEHTEKGEDEDDVPMAQRKRFTRVEMARVLMERNQYKERLMELQEAVRWTEMIRASREHPGELQTQKKKSSVWNFFSNLFSSSNKPKRPSAVATVKYNAPTTQVQPVGDPNKKQRDKGSANPKSKAYDFLQEDLTSEKAKKEREKERREQYKQVRAHVKKDDGRMQAYGWSLPAKFTSHMTRDTPGKSQVPVPVPVYCRPLFETQNGWKIWCAAGVNLTGGRTRDGGSIVGASVFYSNPPEENVEGPAKTDVDRLDKEIKEHEKSVKDHETEQMSSLVWVCTSTHEASRVSVIDANNPADVLETFRVSVSHILCIASIPGATENDYPVAEEILNAEVPDLPKETVVSPGAGLSSGGDSTGLGGVTFVQCATGGSSPISSSPIGSLNETKTEEDGSASSGSKAEENVDNAKEGVPNPEEGEEGDPLGVTPSEEIAQPQVFRAKGSPASSGETTPTHTARLPESCSSNPELVKDGKSSPTFDSSIQNEETEKMSSVLPTMWMGSQSGSMYVHSSVSNWKRCLHSVKLRDSILGIVHVKGRVLVSLADGTVAIFHRASDGQWDLLNYHLLDLGKPKQSIRCMTVIAGKHVWCGYKNKIHVINPQSMAVEKSFDAHPRKESQVRQLCWLGDGVWVSIRLDSTLRLYHAYTHQHLQDVDIEPYVSKMLGTGKLGFSFVRITAMLISCNRLWIGTGNGVIISVPLSESNKQPMITTSSSLGGLGSSGGRPGGVIRVYSDAKTDSITPGSFIPYCSMAQAQLSFHGHKDAVKFFVSVPARNRKSPLHEGIQRKGLSAASDSLPSSTPPPKGEAIPAPMSNTKLVLSGGEGYVDFRMGDGDEEDPNAAIPVMTNDDDDDNPAKASSLTKTDRSHVIVWQVTVPE